MKARRRFLRRRSRSPRAPTRGQSTGGPVLAGLPRSDGFDARLVTRADRDHEGTPGFPGVPSTLSGDCWPCDAHHMDLSTRIRSAHRLRRRDRRPRRAREAMPLNCGDVAPVGMVSPIHRASNTLGGHSSWRPVGADATRLENKLAGRLRNGRPG